MGQQIRVVASVLYMFSLDAINTKDETPSTVLKNNLNFIQQLP